MSLTINVNGQPREWTGRSDLSLLDLLRDEFGITGPKAGCREGACGACTVLIGRRAVQACQLTAAEADGQRVTTVEGLAEDGVLHPVQQAWLETGAMQCGFCTPGWLMGTAALLDRTPHPDDERIDAELAGHVCRCCAYPRIRQAVHRAAELMDDPELLEPVPPARRPDPAAAGAQLAPAVPWDQAGGDPDLFAAAMPEGLMTVVAGPGEASAPDAPDEAWVHVAADGTVTAFTGKVDAGQGTRTALSLLVAEELAVPPDSVSVAMARTDVSPFDLGTFGSRSMPHAAPPLRATAAWALRQLRQDAAARFGLPAEALTAGGGMIAGPDGAPTVSYGDLVAGQRRVERVPADAKVTPAAQWRTAGRPARAAGGADVVTGAKKFPSDLTAAGLLHGCVLRPPSAGAELISADTAPAEAMAGVTVIRHDDLIGVVAGERAAGRAALAAITAQWRERPGPAAAELESYLRAHPAQASGRFGPFRHEEGDPEKALAAAAIRLEAHYSAAYIAHVPLEPRAALAVWRDGELTVHAATSTPFRARRELAEALGLAESAVHLTVPDFGGGFGGKHGSAVALEAARLARASGQPVQVAWSRAEEFTAGYLRPAAFIDVTSGAGADGELTAWTFTNLNSGSAGLMTPYRVPHQRVVYQPADAPLPQGSYRALAATANGFARESHMDELAAALGADPVEFRLRHLDDERLAAVLTAAAGEIGWDQTPAGVESARAEPAGADGARYGTGVALGMEKDGRVATAARVRVAADRTVTVLTLVSVVDCGAVVHPDGLANQVEGAMMMGLGPALFEQIEFDGGVIRNGSMSQYRVPRLADLPADLRVVLADRPGQPSAGGGEAPIIAVAPAIANAIFRACGTRLRSMPLLPAGRLPGGRRPA
jgi:CO/xanthine dehydrogenase Mo-binding subunit/aerobic-type carbon monoxide dehydrogenase small subunit (CoxS/CutS family)